MYAELFNVGGHALARKHKGGVDAGVYAAGNVGVNAVTHQNGLFGGAAVFFHAEQRHVRLGLADEVGLFAGGPGKHLAHAAAVRHRAIAGGAHPVRVGGDPVYAAAQQNAGILQLLKGELGVKAAYQKVDIVLQVVRDGKARLGQLLAESAGAGGINFGVLFAVGAQIPDGGIHRGEKILFGGEVDAHAQKPLHIGIHAA